MAVNTFRGKYGALPGDIADPAASSFGFQPRGQYAGEGDGNGFIEGNYNHTINGNFSTFQNAGETLLFWDDLSKAGLVAGSFPSANADGGNTLVYTATSSPPLNSFFPSAAISGNYIYAWSPDDGARNNFFGLSAVVDIGSISRGLINSNPGLTVAQASSIDKKIDDGMPQSGAVIALYETSTDDPDSFEKVVFVVRGLNQSAYSSAVACPILAAEPFNERWSLRMAASATSSDFRKQRSEFSQVLTTRLV